MGNIFYIDGEFVAEENAMIPANDLSVLRGYGAFDFLRTYNGKPFRLREHLERLRRSANLIGMDELPASLEEIEAITLETLARNGHEESNVRIVITGGISTNNIIPQGNSILMVMVTPAMPLPKWWYEAGAKIITYAEERFIPGAKSINYLGAILALKEAHRQDAIEAIYVDRYDYVLEGTTTNLFIFKERTLITTEENILPGITRQVMIELADGHYEIEMRPIQREELYDADEVFITASNKEVVPIIEVDDRIIGEGKIGEQTRHIMNLFREETKRFAMGETLET